MSYVGNASIRLPRLATRLLALLLVAQAAPTFAQPTVTSVSVPGNGDYVAGQNLDFTVNFNAVNNSVYVTGTPQLALVIDTPGVVQASYLSGSGTSALVFRYTVGPTDKDADGITVGALTLNGGTIRDVLNADANLTLNAVGSTSLVLVNTACSVDASCGPGFWCMASTQTCVLKLNNGTAMPTDPGHVPTLNGTCTIGAGSAVCVSGVCDRNNNACGLLDGDGTCSQNAQCDTAFCSLSGPTAGTCQPPFSIGAAPPDPAVDQGKGADITVSTNALAPTGATVAWSVSGLPAGVTAQFNPDSVTVGASSTLTVSADYTAVPGATTVVTVKGSTAYGDQSTSLQLTVWDVVFSDGFE